MEMRNAVPQMRHLSQYLQSTTGFRIKPVHGILSQRDFLNALAHRVFCSTQYIRHPATRDYTEEPDILREIVGHISMLGDPVIANLTQEIGLLSLGATDRQIAELGSIYWFTVEFGAVRDGKGFRSYGAGVAGSVGELKHFISDKARFAPLDPSKNIHETFVIQAMQHEYKYCNTIEDAFKELQTFGRLLEKKATMAYDPKTQTIVTDREVRGSFKGHAGLFF